MLQHFKIPRQATCGLRGTELRLLLASNPSSHAAVTPRGAVTPTVDMQLGLLLLLLQLLLINSRSITKQHTEAGRNRRSCSIDALTYLCMVRLLKNSRADQRQMRATICSRFPYCCCCCCSSCITCQQRAEWRVKCEEWEGREDAPFA